MKNNLCGIMCHELECPKTIEGQCAVYSSKGVLFRCRMGKCPIVPVKSIIAQKKVNPLKASKKRI